MNECTVRQLRPSALERRFDLVVAERAPERDRRALIEQYLQATSRWNGKASSRVLQHRIDPLTSDSWEPVQEVRDCRTSFEVLEECLHGHARPSEQPGTTDFPGYAFHGGALSPVQHIRKIHQDCGGNG